MPTPQPPALTWLRTLRNLFLPPHFADKDLQRRASYVHLLILITCGSSWLLGFIDFFNGNHITLVIVAAGNILLVTAYLLNQRGQITPAGYLMVILLTIMVTIIISLGQGIHDISIVIYPTIIIIASFILSGRGTIYTTAFIWLCLSTVVLGETYGWLQVQAYKTNLADILITSIVVLVAAFTTRMLTQALEQALITARTNEENLKEKNEAIRFQAELLDRVGQAVIAADAHNKIVYWNGGAANYYGWREAEVLGQEIFSITPTNLSPATQAEIQHRLHEGKNWVGEMEVQTRTGEWRLMFSTITPIRQTPQSALQGWVSVTADISEHKQTQAQIGQLNKDLEEQTQRLLTLQKIGQAISSLDNLAAVLHKIRETLQQTLSLDVFSVALYDATREELSYPLYYDSGREWAEPPIPLSSSTISSQIIRARQPILVNRTPAEVHAFQNSPTTDVKGARDKISASILATPLIIGERVIGMIAVHSYHYNAYNQSHVELLTGVSYPVAIAVENARLYEALQVELEERKRAEAQAQQRNEQLATMNEIGRAVSTLQNLEQVLELIYRQTQRLALVDAFYIGLYDATKNEISFPLTYDSEVRYNEPTTQLLPDTWIAQVIESGKPFLLLRSAEELAQPHTRGVGNARRSASILLVPLWLGQRVLGVLSIQSYTLKAYSQELAEILTGIGHQAAIAIENARLYSVLQLELEERKRAEVLLSNSLHEKEVLLKEIHHRVKNNMQVIVSLINLQSAQVTDENLSRILRESQNRVRSMALVHEKLYQSKNLAQINFRDYIQQLASTLFTSYQAEAQLVDLVLEVPEFALAVDLAVPCGLIMNELLSNALKHAFPHNQQGVVTVGLRALPNGRIELSVADNGVGIPVEKDWRQTESLGIQLVQSLAKQINGTIELIHLTPGTCFILSFTVPSH